MKSEKWIVVTTIQAPTESIAALSRLAGQGWSVVVVGDTKTPADWEAENITYLSIREQHRIFGQILAPHSPADLDADGSVGHDGFVAYSDPHL